jgi:RNA polymerase sigma-70 factor (ECF subfamily)
MAMVREGQAEALEALYDRYAGVCYGLALRILGDRQDAEEVVQDTFVSLWRRAGTYNPRYGRPYSWLLKIARNRAIDQLRRRSSPRRPRQIPEGAPELARGSDAVEEVAGASELRSMVGGALEGLPPDQREVLEMAYMGGLSQREISERTGIPLGTVKTRTRLALKKLRASLHPLLGRQTDPHGL